VHACTIRNNVADGASSRAPVAPARRDVVRVPKKLRAFKTARRGAINPTTMPSSIVSLAAEAQATGAPATETPVPAAVGDDRLAEEESLDPDDWTAFRAWAHAALDDAIEFTRTVRDRPAWQPVPAAVKSELRRPLPRGPGRLEAMYDDFKRLILPYPTGNVHPRFWGWVMGSGTPEAIVAEMLAATMNAHVAGYDQSAALVEEQVLAWLSQALAFPEAATGVLTSGGTMANLLGVTAARNTLAGCDVREEGVRGGAPLVVYASTETHHWVDAACETLGIGRRGLRRVRCDASYRIDVAALARAIAEDRRAGRRPLCIVGTAGTVNTGAIDDIDALARVSRDEAMWLHVDGAFGALAALSPALRPEVFGMERADSLAFDLHKWGYLPYGVGCVLVRDPDAHRRAFASAASYIAPSRGGIMKEPFVFAERGIELSRSFRALKVWMSLRLHGADKWGRLIEQNVHQARYLASRIAREPALELLAPVSLNVVCFRVRDPRLGAAELDALNERVLVRVQESGIAVPSSTRIDGRFALRVAITNHRSRREDFDVLVDAVLDAARAAVGGGVAPGA